MGAVLYNIDDTNVQPGTPVQAAKLQGEYDFELSQTGTIVAATQYGPIIRAASSITLVSIQAAITEAIATGSDRTVNIDLQRSTGAGAFATVLSATIQFTSSSALRTVSSGTLTTTTLAQGDMLRYVITVAGSLSAQATGLVVRTVYRENPA